MCIKYKALIPNTAPYPAHRETYSMHIEVLVSELADATSSKVSLPQLRQMHLYNPLPISLPIPGSLRT